MSDRRLLPVRGCCASSRPGVRAAAGSFALGLLALGAVTPAPAHAYGPEGHLIAGRAAEPLLCAAARREIGRLRPGEDLGEIGLWADRIRSDARYSDAAPWHYVNVSDARELDTLAHPPEGDVLWAIRHFAARLADVSLGTGERAEALAFLVHFVVDLHQPLHVGLAEDRGGNRILLRFRGETTNLHRFWDTHAIEARERSLGQYTRVVRQRAADLPRELRSDPFDWAREGLALRPAVYAFGREGAEPPETYIGFAARTTEDRLVLAARRLASMLDSLLCATR